MTNANNIDYNFRIKFSGYEVDEHECPLIFKGNELWKQNKIRGALICFDAVISSLLKQEILLDDLSDANDTNQLFYASKSKAQLLYKLFIENRLRDVDEYKEVFDVYDNCYQKIKDNSAENSSAPFFLYSLMWDKGILYRKLGEKENARSCFEIALNMIEKMIQEDPTDDLLYYRKAELLYMLDMREQAVETYRMCIELSIDADTIADCEKRIEEINNPNLY